MISSKEGTGKTAIKTADYNERFRSAAHTGKWAVTMAQVRIRQAVAQAPFPHWHILSFVGKGGRESRGIVDLIAIRKDHTLPLDGMKRGDAFQIVLIQVKGGAAARPTAEDGRRLRKVKQLHNAHEVLLASWKKGAAARFYALVPDQANGESDWTEVEDLKTVFC